MTVKGTSFSNAVRNNVIFTELIDGQWKVINVDSARGNTIFSMAHVKKACNRNRFFVGVGLLNLGLDLSDPSTGGETPAPDKSGGKHLRFRFAFYTFFLHEPSQ